ncbi:MAG: protein phosphatase 2C domain-containing protein [Azoarcus sp.]|jgi:hypothetical protein|nr:protein phosphatase 2C domain-containing protein [Azoarcus sp.]
MDDGKATDWRGVPARKGLGAAPGREGPNWQAAFRSVRGRGHIKQGTPCQDCSTIERLPRDGLAILVADGAGSTPLGGKGAEIAIDAALAFIERDQGMDKTFAERCLAAIRAALQAEAARQRASFKNFACTFLAAIIRQGKTLLIHIGDGGIIVLKRAEGAFELVSEPQKAGEYANQTYFVTSDDPRPRIQTLDDVPVCVAIFTDGVEGSALDWQGKATPHASFFDPLFDELAAASERHEKISRDLEDFLGGAAFDERTDDDKTLALAVDKRRYRIRGRKTETARNEPPVRVLPPSNGLPAERGSSEEEGEKDNRRENRASHDAAAQRAQRKNSPGKGRTGNLPEVPSSAKSRRPKYQEPDGRTRTFIALFVFIGMGLCMGLFLRYIYLKSYDFLTLYDFLIFFLFILCVVIAFFLIIYLIFGDTSNRRH